MTSKNKETRLNPRSEAARALMRVCKEQAYASRVLDAALSKPGWESRDRGLFTELVYGVLRRLYCLDHVLAQVTHKPLRTLDPWTLQHLRIAAYQLLYLERVPTHALIHEAVQQVKQHKSPTLGKFVNAVLRQLQRQQEQSDLRPSSANVADPVELASILYSHPQWLVQRYQQDLGMEQAEARLQQQCLSPPLTLRVHRTWGTREQLAQLLREREIVSEMTPYSADGLILSTSAGESIQELQRQHPRAFMVQDEAAQCIAEWLHPQNNERILDACAAPGGKTAHLAAHAPQAEIFAADIHPRKLRQIEALCTRLGIQNVNTFDADMTRDEPPHPIFDHILCDAPCSGLGTLRKHPEIRYRRSPEDLQRLAATQTRLLAHLSRFVKPGGMLLYSVCTDTREECEEVLEAFLQHHPQFHVDTTPSPSNWQPLFCAPGILKTAPERHQMDAFFAVRLRRKREG